MTARKGRLVGKRASSGIGAGIARAYAQEGAAVALPAFKGVDRAQKLANEINERVAGPLSSLGI